MHKSQTTYNEISGTFNQIATQKFYQRKYFCTGLTSTINWINKKTDMQNGQKETHRN